MLRLMKKNNRLLKIITVFTAFAVMGTSLTIHFNTKPVEVDAAQHIANYDLYTYNGTYYNSFGFSGSEGLDGQIRKDLTTLIYPKGWYTYGSSGEDHLSTQCQYADEDPTNSANMVYLYTRDSVKKNAATSWNREHVWPQSLSNECWGKTKAGTDLLHIRPTYDSTNSSRSNDKYCDVNKASPRTYNGMTFGYGSGEKFEPLDAVKGDVARIIMYVWVAYHDYYSNLPAITNVFESYDTLLKWHTQDKPDVLEGNRNNYCETSIQENRNPFVDHPELAWKIFGNSASSSIKTACMNAYPASGSSTPVEPTGISLNKTTLSLTVGGEALLSATLSPSGATGTVQWSSNASNIASVNQNGRVTGVGAGVATITAKISDSIKAECLVTVSTPSVNVEALSEEVVLNYEGLTETNVELTSSTALSVVGQGNKHVKAVETTKVYNGNGTGGAYENTAGLLKTGTSSATGQIVLTLDGLANKVEILCHDFYKKSSSYPTNSNTVAVNDSEAVLAPYNTSATFGTLEFELAEASKTITIDINKRIFIKEIKLSYIGGDAPAEPTAIEKVNLLDTRASLSYKYTKNETNATVTDTLSYSTFGVSGTSYKDWSNKKSNSNAVYAGQSAGGNNSIQLRATNPAGIVTTASGGKATKVTVSWNSNTTGDRQVDIYGKDSAYESGADLYGSNKGTKLGSIVYGTDTELEITGDYAFIGIRSYSGALFLDSINIEWSDTTTTFEYSNVAIRFGGFLSQALWNDLNEESEIQGYGVMLSIEDGDDVVDFYTELSETKLHPAEANNSQKTQQGVEDLEATYYVWNLYVNIPADQLTEDFTAVAYIATESEIVFFNETTASPRDLANDLLPTYGNGAFEGSLYNLANL